MRGPQPFQLLGADLPDGARGNRLKVLQFGPRYTRPVDDTTVLSVFHRITGGGASVLLERDDIPVLLTWLLAASPPPGRTDTDFLPKTEQPRNLNGSPQYYRALRQSPAQFEVHDLQTTALLTKYNGTSETVLGVAVSWNGSGRTVGAQLGYGGLAALTQWLGDVDRHGWEGWRSGRTAPAPG